MKELKDTILPADFDGTFRFTNFSDEDFVGKWNNVAYTFPAQKTIPLIILGETPEGVQYVRKKFARDLAEREYFRSDKYKSLIVGDKSNSITGGIGYTDSDLTPLIQRCLEPLPLAQAAIKALPKDNDAKYRKDKRGKPVSRILDDGESLVGDGTVMQD